MLYIVQLRYRMEDSEDLRDHFEQRGITGHGDGVVLKGAWVSASRQGFLLLDAKSEDCVQHVCSDLSRFGQLSLTPVISLDQIM